MIPVTSYARKTVAVLGLGGSGLITAKALIAGGAKVLAWDDTPAAREAAREGIKVADLEVEDWRKFSAL